MVAPVVARAVAENRRRLHVGGHGEVARKRELELESLRDSSGVGLVGGNVWAKRLRAHADDVAVVQGEANVDVGADKAAGSLRLVAGSDKRRRGRAADVGAVGQALSKVELKAGAGEREPEVEARVETRVKRDGRRHVPHVATQRTVDEEVDGVAVGGLEIASNEQIHYAVAAHKRVGGVQFILNKDLLREKERKKSEILSPCCRRRSSPRSAA